MLTAFVAAISMSAASARAALTEATIASLTHQPASRPVVEPMDDDARSGLSLSIEPYSVFGLETDFNAGGDVQIRRVGWRLTLSQPINRRWAVALNMTNEYSFTDFSLPAIIGGGDPFGAFTIVRAMPSLTWTGDVWSATFTGQFEYAAESGADVAGSLLGGAMVSVQKRVNDHLKMGLGIGVRTQLEDTLQLILFPRLDWRVSDTLRVFSERFGVNVEKILNDDWKATFKASYEPRQYRLDNGAGDLFPDGVLRDQSVLVGVELAYQPRPGFLAALEVGGILFQQFELLNATGEEQFDDNADPTLFVSGRFVFRF